MENVVFLLSKDCMACESLPVYGNSYWKTPNIDALAAKGTVFMRHYTAGASTSMSLSAMLSGHYLHEFKSRSRYAEVVEPSEFHSIYDTLQEQQYECHLIWNLDWQTDTWGRVREFGDESKVIVHTLDVSQAGGNRARSDNSRHERNDQLAAESLRQIYEAIDSIDYSKKQFVWVHLPHILKGRRSYMDDMDLFDQVVGHVRELVGDDSIYLTSDHGHMNMHKGLVGYGFDVYEPIARIPLITPRINGLEKVDSLTSNTDIPEIIVHHNIPSHKYVYCDTAYYAQLNRKFTVIGERFKYIYNKKHHVEELYDLKWDPREEYNILKPTYFDKNRCSKVVYDELYFYPYREEAMQAYSELANEKDSLWREPSKSQTVYNTLRRMVAVVRDRIRYWRS